MGVGGTANRVRVRLEAQPRSAEHGELSALQRQIGPVDDVPGQQVVHVLVAVVQVGRDRRRLVRSCRRDACLEEAVNADVDVRRRRDVGDLSEAQQTAALVEADGDH